MIKLKLEEWPSLNSEDTYNLSRTEYAAASVIEKLGASLYCKF